MRGRSAAFELMFLTVLVMAVLLVAFTWLTVRWQRQWLLDEAQRGLALASETLHSALRDGMMRNRPDEIRDTIQGVGRDTRIKEIRILNHRGQVKLSTRPEEINRVVAPGDPPCSMCHSGARNDVPPGTLLAETRTSLQGKTLRAFAPIVAEPGCLTSSCHTRDADSKILGVIELGLSLRQLEQTLARNQLEMGIASVIAILVGGGLLWLALAFRFSRPMNDVMSGIRRVAGGDLKYRIPVRARDEFGQLAGSFNAMNEQLEVLQEGMIQSERLISMGKLAAGVAHEINNPLTGILSYAEDLVSETDPSDPRRQDCEVIVREALRCRQIVRNLLDFARQDKPSRAPVHPRKLIETTLDMLGRQVSFRNVSFSIGIEDDLPAVEVDRVQIEQVLVNLIVNAQQAMPQGGEIEIRARCTTDGRRVEFSVRDEGVGIPPEIRPHVFDPFFSTKGGTTDGLGLSICLGIIQRHGGTIDFQTEVGKGTAFRFEIPIVRKQQSEGGIHE